MKANYLFIIILPNSVFKLRIMSLISSMVINIMRKTRVLALGNLKECVNTRFFKDTTVGIRMSGFQIPTVFFIVLF